GLLSEHRIGALVVSANGRNVDGILSERDIVGRLGAEGASMMSHKIEDLMTANVETCIGDDTAFDLLGRMTEGRFRHMPVLGSDGAMIGILSIGDVVKARLEEIESENAAMADMLSGEVF
ncbi:MAG: CBS domain-containing protein, partial [Pseudomonadota bacterium]